MIESTYRVPPRSDNCRGRGTRNWRFPMRDDSSSPHGTYSRYSNHDCRCAACKQAAAQYRRARYLLRRDEISAQQRAYREAHKPEIAARDHTYARAHRDQLRAYKRAYYLANRESIRAKQAESHAEHREERNAKGRKWMAASVETRRAFIRGLLLDHVCADCGGAPRDWHHVNPATRTAKVGSMTFYSESSIRAELDKCVPLCRSCHMKRHRRDTDMKGPR
jgi:hypothetical protein